MKIRTEDFSETRKVILHEDFSIPVAAGKLIRHVYDATGHLNWSPTAAAAKGDRPANRMLSSLLTFCYATGIYSSQEIGEAAQHDPVVQYLCANHRPQWEVIRDFRRLNSTGLQVSLSRLFQVVIQDGSRHRLYVDFSLGQLVSEKDCIAAAGQQLKRAVQADSFALDF